MSYRQTCDRCGRIVWNGGHGIDEERDCTQSNGTTCRLVGKIHDLETRLDAFVNPDLFEENLQLYDKVAILKAEIKNFNFSEEQMNQAGTPLARLEYLLKGLAERFPTACNPLMSYSHEDRYLKAIDQMLALLAKDI